MLCSANNKPAPAMENPMSDSRISVGLAQVAPVWLNRDAMIDKVVGWVGKAANEGCSLVVFGGPQT
jgi:hypothetical protein